MDQEPTKRRRSSRTPRRGAGPAAGEAQKSDLAYPDVPDESAAGDEVQVLRKETPGIAPHDPRSAIAEGLSDLLTPVQVTYLLHEILAITKKVPVEGDCPGCGKHFKVMCEVPDAKAVVSALTALLDQSNGRPDVAKMERDLVTFQRFTDFSEWEAENAEGP